MVCFFFCLFKATPMAHGGPPARGRIGAVATATATCDLSRICNPHHSSWQHRILNPMSKARDRTHCICDLHHSSQLRQIFNPLSKARNQTHNFMVPSRIRFRCATPGTLRCVFLSLMAIILPFNYLMGILHVPCLSKNFPV